MWVGGVTGDDRLSTVAGADGDGDLHHVRHQQGFAAWCGISLTPRQAKTDRPLGAVTR